MIREYLTKNIDGGYTLVNHKFTENDIEVPEWSNYAYNNDQGVCFLIHEIKYNHPLLLWKRHTQPEELPLIDDEPKIETATGYQLDVVGKNTYGSRSRESGESDTSYRQYLMNFKIDQSKSLNNQYAEIERVRKHRHYFKDVSNIAEIDVYAVLKLFDVTDPCLQHIVKKALVAGGRGHKDFERDLKDIHDTSKRALEINNILH